MFLPLFLRLEGKRVVVVGGGEIALRKAREVVEVGADVVVIAQDIRGALPPRTTWIARAFRAGDLDGAWLVFAATNDANVQARVAREAGAARTFVVAVDDIEHASAISPAVVRRGDVTIAISSGGAAPALTRLLREIIEQLLPEDRYVQIARELRVKWKRDAMPMHSRFRELVSTLRDV